MTITDPKDISQLGTILGVWAHPDDESVNSAGIIAAAVQNGQQVICITATKGELGVQDVNRWPAEKLGEIRADELAKALDILGVKEHHWLGYRDGECSKISDEEGADRVIEYIDKYRPDTILTFGPDGLTGHIDHQTVSKWVDLANRGANINVYHSVINEEIYNNYLNKLDKQFNMFFNIDEPPLRSKEQCDIALELTTELIRKKYNALKAMPSQYESVFTNTSDDLFDKAFSYECFVRA
jgi:LmbE family N-acetylglucosaminyl deacetylase